MKRTYTDGDPDELGQEPRPADYVERLCAILDRVGEVLAPGGCLFLNLGDTYAVAAGAVPGRSGARAGDQRAGRRRERHGPGRPGPGRGREVAVPGPVAGGAGAGARARLALRQRHRLGQGRARARERLRPVHPSVGADLRPDPSRARLPAASSCPPSTTSGSSPSGAGARPAATPPPSRTRWSSGPSPVACPPGAWCSTPSPGAGRRSRWRTAMGRRFLGCDLLGEPAAGGPR